MARAKTPFTTAQIGILKTRRELSSVQLVPLIAAAGPSRCSKIIRLERDALGFSWIKPPKAPPKKRVRYRSLKPPIALDERQAIANRARDRAFAAAVIAEAVRLGLVAQNVRAA